MPKSEQRVHSGNDLNENGGSLLKNRLGCLGSSACHNTNVECGSETTAFTSGTAVIDGHAPYQPIGARTKLLAEKQGCAV